jgi:hypothetical protein
MESGQLPPKMTDKTKDKTDNYNLRRMTHRNRRKVEKQIMRRKMDLSW